MNLTVSPKLGCYYVSPVNKKQSAHKINAEISAGAAFAPLNSYMGINFTGKGGVEKFALDFEKRIKEDLTVSYEPKNPLSSGVLDKLNEQMEADMISSVYHSGVSLNGALVYLSSKDQLKLMPGIRGTFCAFFVDEFSLEFLRKNKEKFLEDSNNQNMRFYYLGDDKEYQKNAEEFEKITGISKGEVLKIDFKPKKDDFKMPDSKEISSVIKAFSKSKYPYDTKARNKFEEVLCRYLDELFTPFSYQSLAEQLKEQYGIIEKKAGEIGHSMDEVKYVVPSLFKSFSLVSYMYAKENGIDFDKFVTIKDVEEDFKNNPDSFKNTVYVLLDDFSASGESGEQIITHYVPSNKNVPCNFIFSPVIGSETSKDAINSACSKKAGNFIYAPNKTYYDFAKIRDLKFNYSASSELEKYYDMYKKLSVSDISFLMNTLRGGCSELYSLVAFPYMIPDNSSDINTILGSYLLNNDVPIANKGIEGSGGLTVGSRISKEEYLNLKEKISIFN